MVGSRLRVLVTGANGFLGTSVRAVASRGWADKLELVSWDRRAHGDVRRRQDLEACLKVVQPRVVLHLAWRTTGVCGYEYDAANLEWAEGTIQLAEMCGHQGVWFVGCGSGIELDPSADRTPYIAAKQQVHQALIYGCAGPSWTWLLPSWVFSLDQRRPRVLAAALKATARGENFSPKEPNAMHDFIEVADVASGMLTVLSQGFLGDQDLASGQRRSVGALLHAADCGTRGASAKPVLWTSPSLERLLSTGWTPEATNRTFMLKGSQLY